MTLRKEFSVIAALFVALALVLGIAQMSSAADMSDGLVGYWDMDGDASEPVHSVSGVVNGVTSFHASALSIGSTNNAAFDGIGDFIEVADNAELDLTAAVSVAGWIFVDSTAAQQGTVAAKWGDLAENQRGYLLAIHTDETPRFYVSHTGVDFPSAVGAPIADGWHYLVGTFDGTTISLYVDNVLVDTTVSGGAIFSNNESLLIGANDGFGGVLRKFTTGGVDEVRIYDRALTVEEVAALSSYSFDIVLTPDDAVNPLGTEHTVTATLTPALSYIPVLFERSGVNGFDSTFGTTSDHYEPYYTDENGQVDYAYTGTVSGLDTIVGCVDVSWFFTGGGICNQPFLEPSDSVVKTWFVDHFVTGGGNIKVGKKVLWSYGGTVGQFEGGGIVGNLQIVNHANKVSCHFKEIDDLVFSGSTTTSPVSAKNIATFAASGTCNNGDAPSITVVITDNAEPGAGADTIVVTENFGAEYVSLDNTAPGTLSGGNFQVHPPEEI